uniref:Uncharacterized protein n=1 Tax=Knipowitschia caucasica TaxID=637954 RepID=A0AAV2KUA4_KNICA
MSTHGWAELAWICRGGGWGGGGSCVSEGAPAGQKGRDRDERGPRALTVRLQAGPVPSRLRPEEGAAYLALPPPWPRALAAGGGRCHVGPSVSCVCGQPAATSHDFFLLASLSTQSAIPASVGITPDLTPDAADLSSSAPPLRVLRALFSKPGRVLTSGVVLLRRAETHAEPPHDQRIHLRQTRTLRSYENIRKCEVSPQSLPGPRACRAPGQQDLTDMALSLQMGKQRVLGSVGLAPVAEDETEQMSRLMGIEGSV